jgi:hypothetical protein
MADDQHVEANLKGMDDLDFEGWFEDGSRMVTVAKWRDGAIAEEYIWA